MFFVIFPLLVFNILSLSLIFLSLIIMCWCVPPQVYPAGNSLCFLDLVDHSLSLLGTFSVIISSNIFMGSFSLSPPPSGTCIMHMLVCLMLSQRSLRLSFFFFFHSFFYILFCGVISTVCLQCHISVLLPELFCYRFLPVHCSSLFLLQFFWVFGKHFLHLLHSFPRSWIIFTITILNSFFGRLPIFT